MPQKVQGRTRENLMKAFAGESQARNRYSFAACVAKEQGYEAIGKIFDFTADQEKEHAEIFYHLLKESTGETIGLEGTYPVDDYDDLLSLLKSSMHNEYQEYEVDYPHFSEVAKEEGYPDIAAKFKMIAEIERLHGQRYEYLAELLEKGALYQSNTPKRWVCENCGHSYVSDKVVVKCPVCSHDQGYFLPEELAPYVLKQNS